jgi:hypothetical protein
MLTKAKKRFFLTLDPQFHAEIVVSAQQTERGISAGGKGQRKQSNGLQNFPDVFSVSPGEAGAGGGVIKGENEVYTLLVVFAIKEKRRVEGVSKPGDAFQSNHFGAIHA